MSALSLNLQNYTDDELYEILDLVKPSDKILEAKIIQMLEKCSGNQELFSFFTDVYNRFFESGSDDEEGEAGDESDAGIENFSGLDISGGDGGDGGSGGSDDKIKPLLPIVANIDLSGAGAGAGAAGSSSVAVSNFTYKKDYINPLLQQTIKRIISIDSQYRNLKTYSLSTDFTINLSEPLRDVVQLTLYSVQIPLTWYTVSNSYGSNFFYLKAISAGIDTGYYDYMIDISAGNYSPSTLTAAINSSIARVSQVYTDVSFGTTNLSYNSSTSNATITVDLQHIFNENNYRLEFADWSSPTDEASRYSSSLPAFLGYNFISYAPNTIFSQQTLPSESNNSVDTTFSGYVVDASNNYFTICQYLPTIDAGGDVAEWDGDLNSSTIMQKIIIRLSLTAGSYNRKTVVDDLNTQLATNAYLSGANISRKYSLNNDGSNINNSFFAMKINLNTKVTQNRANAKVVVVFPTEADGVQPKIWTYDTTGIYSSCFSFNAVVNEVNNIVAETNTLQSNYIITSSPYFVLRCTSSGYINPNSSVDYSAVGYKSWNDYVVKVPNIASPGYSLTAYLSAITGGFSTTNTQLLLGGNQSVFNTTYSLAYNNADSNYLAAISVDLNKVFNTSQYNLDLSGKYLFTDLGLSNGAVVDLSGNNSFDSLNQTILPTYIVDNPILMRIYPKMGEDGLSATEYWDVPAVTELLSGLDLNTFIYYVNQSFKLFSDRPNNFPLINSTISYTLTNTIPIRVNFFMTINIQNYLTQNDYDIVFFDPAASGGWDTTDNNSWYSYLDFDHLYSLAVFAVSGSSYSTIFGNSTIAGYTYSITEDTSFKLSAIGSGVNTASGDYDITVNIPAAGSPYTRGKLFDLINGQLAANVLTAGSYFKTTTINSLVYVVFRCNINKIFNSADYNLVFFDSASFVKCYSGVSSVRNATWDSTIGWTLGFRAQTVYALADYYSVVVVVGFLVYQQ